MSYILEALKKSEEERERRRPQGLMEAPSFAPAQPGKTRRNYFLSAALLINALALIVVFQPWQMVSKKDTSREAPNTQPKKTQPVESPQTSRVIPPAAQPNQPVKQTRNAQSAATAVHEETAAPPEAPSSVQPRPEPGQAENVRPRQEARSEKIKVSKQQRTMEPVKSLRQEARRSAGPGSRELLADLQSLASLDEQSAKPAASPRVVRENDLSSAVRGSIPKVTLSMLVYSQNAAERWVSVNGSKKREGQEVAPGLKVEEITPDGAVMSYMGQRFYKAVIGD